MFDVKTVVRRQSLETIFFSSLSCTSLRGQAGTDVELARVPGSSAALTALLSKLQDNHRTWEAAFDALDADDSGELDQGEIAQVLRRDRKR